MSARLLLLTLLATVAVPLAAQPFTVEGSSLPDYATGVPLETTLAFTFSEPVLRLGSGCSEPECAYPVLAIQPSAAVEIERPTLSGDGLTVSYDLTLQPDTRYVAVFLDAESADGDTLARPFVRNFTTAATGGSFSVSGTVTSDDGGGLDGTLVALVTGDFGTGEIRLAAVEVLDATGGSQSYGLGPVEAGLYTAGAVRLPRGALHGLFERTGEAPGPLLGFYDPNGDGTPDPILLPFGVDVMVGPPEPITAGAYFPAVAAAAATVIPAPLARNISPREVDETGRASYWIYEFGQEEAGDDAVVVQMGFLTLPILRENNSQSIRSLPIPFVDSDAVMTTFMAAGGADFLAAHADDFVSITLAAYTWNGPAYWLGRFEAWEYDGGPWAGELELAADMETGELIPWPVANEPTGEADSAPTVTVQPNPVGAEATVRFTLARPGPVRLAVYDARGREVAVLMDEARGAGAHAVRWRPDGLAAGIYLLRLEGTEGTVVRVASFRR